MHKSVLLEEAIKGLNIRDGLIYVDCTLGYAGHSGEILKKDKKGWLYAFDQDSDAIEYSNKKLASIGPNFEIIKSNFKNLKKELEKRGITKVDGILFDLGVSSPQLDIDERGFSYHKDARLDMRMDKDNPLSAYEVVNNYSESELITIFFRYGEERYSKSIARKIIEYRKEKPIETTLELVEIIKTGVPEKYKRETHPAKRVFQAIRIEVNKELEVFEIALKDAIDLLNENGRICVITFHSLEDKICKDIFKKNSEVDKVFKGLPNIPYEYMPKLKIIDKIVPSNKELEENNRARSATLRIAERIKK
ncbi:MAG: 16S rRNA (cytosine(1402)-N(4))-methyltransferase RsmH [Bacilli bacterium]|nr:16S rRNA (cytosine(1402)-N(4))-methyltransferase RsmH [Bacilli bacterium]MBQ6282390.1 16S rRNA (cytosine(1402)-N(4))-methyltransferase RsmH [Bacilli bacterium]